MTTLKQVFDKLLDTFSQGKLAPIALKVAAKYNDGAVADTLNLEKDIAKIADDLFASSDRAFIEGLVGSEDYKDIADEVGFEIVEGFNN
jgi:hypothetical protein